MWFAFATLSAFMNSLADVFGKRAGGRFDPAVTAWGQRLCAAVLMAGVALVLTRRLPSTDAVFWEALAVTAAINTATSIMYMRALHASPLSVTTPVLALSPTFLLATEPLISGEWVSMLGVVGVLVSLGGAYLLGLDRLDEGWLSPIRNLWRQPGSRLMLGVAVLWSLSAPFDKIAIRHTEALWYPALITGALSCSLLPFALRRGLGRALNLRGLAALAPIGAGMGLAQLFQSLAFSLASVAYVISVKRLSAVFGVLFGWSLYHESGARIRLVGAAVLCLGAVIILLGGR